MKEYTIIADGDGKFTQEFDPPLTKGERVNITVTKGQSVNRQTVVAPTSKYNVPPRPETFVLAITGRFEDGYHARIGRNESTAFSAILSSGDSTSELSDLMKSFGKVRKVSTLGNATQSPMLDSAIAVRELEIYDGAQSVSANFAIATKVNKLILPESLKSVGVASFASAMNIDELLLPTNLETIGTQGFAGAFNVKRLVFLGNKVTSIGDYALSSMYQLEHAFTLPNSLVTVGNGAFSGTGGLYAPLSGYLTIPASVKNLGNGAFERFRQEGLRFAEGFNMATIPEKCFSDWISATLKLKIPDGVVTIKKQAFEAHVYCPELELPTSLRNLEDRAFGGWFNITKLIIRSPVKLNMHIDAFEGLANYTRNSIRIEVPSNLVESYKNDSAIYSLGLEERVFAISS